MAPSLADAGCGGGVRRYRTRGSGGSSEDGDGSAQTAERMKDEE